MATLVYDNDLFLLGVIGELNVEGGSYVMEVTEFEDLCTNVDGVASKDLLIESKFRDLDLGKVHSSFSK